MVASATTNQYYLRANGKIRGPFELERLRSMRERNRLGPRDELSADRRAWMPAGTVTAIFPDGFAGVERDAEAADWHYMRAGKQAGPVTLMTLQALSQSGELTPQDSVWRLGTSGWILASQVPELSFPPSRSWWNSLHAVTRLGIVVAGVLLVITPMWLVLGYYQKQVEYRKWVAEQDLKAHMNREMAEAHAAGVAAHEANEEKRNNKLVAAEQDSARAAREGAEATREGTRATENLNQDANQNAADIKWKLDHPKKPR